MSEADGDPLTLVWRVNGTPIYTNFPTAGPAPNLQTWGNSFWFVPGTNVVTVVATDPAGGIATCSTWVVVSSDTTPPSLMCKGIVKLCANQNCQATLPALMPGAMSDNCTPVSQLIATQNPPPAQSWGWACTTSR